MPCLQDTGLGCPVALLVGFPSKVSGGSGRWGVQLGWGVQLSQTYTSHDMITLLLRRSRKSEYHHWSTSVCLFFFTDYILSSSVTVGLWRRHMMTYEVTSRSRPRTLSRYSLECVPLSSFSRQRSLKKHMDPSLVYSRTSITHTNTGPPGWSVPSVMVWWFRVRPSSCCLSSYPSWTVCTGLEWWSWFPFWSWSHTVWRPVGIEMFPLPLHHVSFESLPH